MTLRQRLEGDGIAWEDGFLSPELCAELVEELDFAFWRPSSVINVSEDGELRPVRSDTRVSESTGQDWFTADLKRELAKVERRLQRRLGLARERLELWQATRYRLGGAFGLHNDAGVFGGEAAGERTTTILLYLKAPARGGATRFPALDIDIAARPGRLVVWNNLERDGSVDWSMVHTAEPVKRGVKVTLTSWARRGRAR